MGDAADRTPVRFGLFEADFRAGELYLRGSKVGLQEQPFRALALLVERAGQVVTHQELAAALWQEGIHVEFEQGIHNAIKKLRRALRDSSARPRWIETVGRRGYRFIGEIESEKIRAPKPGARLAPAARPLAPVPGVPVPVREPHEAHRGRAQAPRREPFVGRERELGILRAGLSAAAAGHGGVILLVGQPGIGKTRIAEEFAQRARAEGAEVLVGRCYEGEGAPAFWPWMQVLRAYALARDAPTLTAELGAAGAELAAICPEIRARLPGLAEPPVLEPAQARFRFFEGVATAFARAAGMRPLVVLLDDLQGADESSLLLLQFLARTLREQAVLVVGGIRDRALARHELAGTLGELVREQVGEQLALAGLTEPEVGELLAQIAGEAASAGLAAAVWRRTEGNPLYVKEIARMLGAAGGLAQVPADGRIAMPDSVRLAIGGSLRGLSTPCHDLLTLASLIGREFRVETLTRVSSVDAEQVLTLLDEAEAARVVDAMAGEPGRRRFAHALFGETLAEALGAADKARRHRRLAETLASDPRAPEHAAEIAHHWMQAGPAGKPEETVTWLCRAAERALGHLANEEAARLYRLALRALDSMEDSSGERRAAVLLGLGEAYKRAGEPAESKRAFLEAAALGRSLGSPELLTQAALGYAPSLAYAEQTEPDAAVVRLLEEAIEAWDGRECGLHARALAHLALALFFGDRAKRIALVERAMALARGLRDPATLCYVIARWLMTFANRYDPELRLAAATELAGLAAEANDLEALAVGRLWRAVHLLETGDAAAMRREHAAFARLAAELRQPLWSWYRCVTEGTDALLDGRFDDAERAFAEGLRVGQGVLPWAARTYFVGSMMFLGVLQGRPGAFATEYRSIAEAHPVHGAISPLAWVESERGNSSEARRIVERLTAESFSHLLNDFEWFVSAWFVAEGCAHLGDVPRAAQLYEHLTPFASRWVVWAEAVPLGPVTHCLGLLARTLGRLDEAAAHFEAALASATRAAAPPYLARAQYEYALLLQTRRSRGDAERAASLLAEARATAGAIGMSGLLAKVAALEDPGPAAPDEAVRPPGD